MNAEKLKELRELVAAAERGPWTVAEGHAGAVESPQHWVMSSLYCYSPTPEANARLIAAMHEALPALLDEVEALTTKLAGEQEAYDGLADKYEQFEAEVKALTADAERYRWLRENAVEGRMESRGPRPDFAMNCDEPETEWDTAIDAARHEPKDAE